MSEKDIINYLDAHKNEYIELEDLLYDLNVSNKCRGCLNEVIEIFNSYQSNN